MTAASGLAVDNSAEPPVVWTPLLKDAVLAALVAVLLALPLVGLQTYDIGGGALGIRTHFDWVAVAGAAVFAGRLALRVLQQLYRTRPTGQSSWAKCVASRKRSCDGRQKWRNFVVMLGCFRDNPLTHGIPQHGGLRAEHGLLSNCWPRWQCDAAASRKEKTWRKSNPRRVAPI